MVQVGETGTVSLNGTIDASTPSYASVTFSKTYDSPVVVTYMTTNNGAQSIGTRVRNLSGGSCEIFMEEPDGAASHTTETIAYMVLEAGVHTIDGVDMEAGIVNFNPNNNADWIHHEGEATGVGYGVNFVKSFDTTPVLLCSLVTHNNGNFMESAVNSITSSGFNAQHMAQGTGNSPDNESFAYIAIEGPSTGYISGNYYELGARYDGSGDGHDNTEHTETFNSTFSYAPDTIVHGQTTDWSDGYWARGNGVTTGDFGVWAEEDQVSTTERGHNDEKFGWFAVDPDSTFSATKIASPFLGYSADGTYREVPVYASDDVRETFARTHTPSGTGVLPFWDRSKADTAFVKLDTASGKKCLSTKPYIPESYALAQSQSSDSIIDDFEGTSFDTSIWNGTVTGTQTLEGSTPAPAEGSQSLEQYDGAVTSSGATGIDYPAWGDAIEFYNRAEAADDYLTVYVQFNSTSDTYYVNYQYDTGYMYLKKVSGGATTTMYEDLNANPSADTWYYNKIEFIDKATEKIRWYSEEVPTASTYVDTTQSTGVSGMQYNGVRLAIDSLSTANFDYVNTVLNGAI